MPLDVYRGDDGTYHVQADLPGVDPDCIEVTVDSGALTIQAARTPAYSDTQQVIVAERSQGSFARQLSLGEGVDSENLTADYADGVLHVTIPLSAEPAAQDRDHSCDRRWPHHLGEHRRAGRRARRHHWRRRLKPPSPAAPHVTWKPGRLSVIADIQTSWAAPGYCSPRDQPPALLTRAMTSPSR